jgi:hypothetical protein
MRLGDAPDVVHRTIPPVPHEIPERGAAGRLTLLDLQHEGLKVKILAADGAAFMGSHGRERLVGTGDNVVCIHDSFLGPSKNVATPDGEA